MDWKTVSREELLNVNNWRIDKGLEDDRHIVFNRLNNGYIFYANRYKNLEEAIKDNLEEAILQLKASNYEIV